MVVGPEASGCLIGQCKAIVALVEQLASELVMSGCRTPVQDADGQVAENLGKGEWCLPIRSGSPIP